MAKVSAPYKISGKLDNLQFYMRDGKNFVRPATFPRRMPDDYYVGRTVQLQNRFGFAGAVAVTNFIYEKASGIPRSALRPYAHNHIRGRIRRLIELAPDIWRIEFPVIYHALHQLDLSDELGPSPILHTTLIGPSNRPTHLRLSNLRELTKAVQDRGRVHGNAQLQMRIQLNWAPYRTHVFDRHTRAWSNEYDVHEQGTDITSQWLPAHLLPEDGLTLAAQPQKALLEHLPYLLFLIIEWREYRPVTEEIILHPKQGTCRIFAVQYSPTDQQGIDHITNRLLQQAKKEKPTPESAQDLNEAFKGMM